MAASGLGKSLSRHRHRPHAVHFSQTRYRLCTHGISGRRLAMYISTCIEDYLNPASFVQLKAKLKIFLQKSILIFLLTNKCGDRQQLQHWTRFEHGLFYIFHFIFNLLDATVNSYHGTSGLI